MEIDSKKYSFLVSAESLADLLKTREKFDLVAAYEKYIEKIHNAAEVAVLNGHEGNPIIISYVMIK